LIYVGDHADDNAAIVQNGAQNAFGSPRVVISSACGGDGRKSMTTLLIFLKALLIAAAIVYVTFGFVRLAAHCVLLAVRSIRPRGSKH